MKIVYVITYTTDGAKTVNTVEVSAASLTKAVMAAAEVLPAEICKGDEDLHAILGVRIKSID